MVVKIIGHRLCCSFVFGIDIAFLYRYIVITAKRFAV
jgi:hypothetical protein